MVIKRPLGILPARQRLAGLGLLVILFSSLILDSIPVNAEELNPTAPFIHLGDGKSAAMALDENGKPILPGLKITG